MAVKPTISDVAARAGVSKGAVSFALNNRAGVSADTRARILRAAADLGFTPSATARALSTRRSGSLGLVMARPHATLRSDPFFPAFIAGIESALAPSGHLLSVRLVGDEDAEAGAYGELARSGRVDGVFVTDLRFGDPRAALLEELGLAAVTLNRPEVAGAAPAVCIDDGPAVRDAVQQLIAWATAGSLRSAALPGTCTPRTGALSGRRFSGTLAFLKDRIRTRISAPPAALRPPGRCSTPRIGRPRSCTPAT